MLDQYQGLIGMVTGVLGLTVAAAVATKGFYIDFLSIPIWW